MHSTRLHSCKSFWFIWHIPNREELYNTMYTNVSVLMSTHLLSSSVGSGMVLMNKNSGYKDGIGSKVCDNYRRIGHTHPNCFCLGGEKEEQWSDW